MSRFITLLLLLIVAFAAANTATVEFEQLAQAHESLRAHIEGTLAAVEHASGSETAAFALLNRLHDTQAMLELEATQTQQVLNGLEATDASEVATQLREYAEQTSAAREAVSDAHEQLSESLEQAHHAAQSQSEEMSAARLRVAQLEQHVAALESRQSSLVDAQHADAVSGNQAHGTHDARMIELSELQRDLANAQIRLEDSRQKLSKQRARKTDDDVPLFQLDVLTPEMITPEFSLKKRNGDKQSTGSGKQSGKESDKPKQRSDRPDFTLAVARLRRVLNVAMDIKRGEFVLRKRSIGAVDLDAKAPADAAGPAFRLRKVSLDKSGGVEKAFDIDEPKVTVHGGKKGAAEFTIRQVHQPAAQAAEFALRKVESSDQSLKGAIFLSQASEALDVHEAFELTEVKPNRPIKVTSVNVDAIKVTPVDVDNSIKVTPVDVDNSIKVTPVDVKDGSIKVIPVDVDNKIKVTPVDTDGKIKVTPVDVDNQVKMIPVKTAGPQFVPINVATPAPAKVASESLRRAEVDAKIKVASAFQHLQQLLKAKADKSEIDEAQRAWQQHVQQHRNIKGQLSPKSGRKLKCFRAHHPDGTPIIDAAEIKEVRRALAQAKDPRAKRVCGPPTIENGEETDDSVKCFRLVHRASGQPVTDTHEYSSIVAALKKRHDKRVDSICPLELKAGESEIPDGLSFLALESKQHATLSEQQLLSDIMLLEVLHSGAALPPKRRVKSFSSSKSSTFELTPVTDSKAGTKSTKFSLTPVNDKRKPAVFQLTPINEKRKSTVFQLTPVAQKQADPFAAQKIDLSSAVDLTPVMVAPKSGVISETAMLDAQKRHKAIQNELDSLVNEELPPLVTKQEMPPLQRRSLFGHIGQRVAESRIRLATTEQAAKKQNVDLSVAVQLTPASQLKSELIAHKYHRYQRLVALLARVQALLQEQHSVNSLIKQYHTELKADLERQKQIQAARGPTPAPPSTKSLFAASSVANAAAKQAQELARKIEEAHQQQDTQRAAELKKQLAIVEQAAAVAAAVVTAGRGFAPSAESCATADSLINRLKEAESKTRESLKALQSKYSESSPLSSQIASLIELRDSAVDKAAAGMSAETAVDLDSMRTIADMNQRLKFMQAAQKARATLKRIAQQLLVANAAQLACKQSSTSDLAVEHVITIHVIDPAVEAAQKKAEAKQDDSSTLKVGHEVTLHILKPNADEGAQFLAMEGTAVHTTTSEVAPMTLVQLQTASAEVVKQLKTVADTLARAQKRLSAVSAALTSQDKRIDTAASALKTSETASTSRLFALQQVKARLMDADAAQSVYKSRLQTVSTMREQVVQQVTSMTQQLENLRRQALSFGPAAKAISTEIQQSLKQVHAIDVLYSKDAQLAALQLVATQQKIKSQETRVQKLVAQWAEHNTAAAAWRTESKALMDRVYAMATALDKRAELIRQIRQQLNDARSAGQNTASVAASVANLRAAQPKLLEEISQFRVRVDAFDRLTLAVAAPSEASEARDIGQWVALILAQSRTQDEQIGSLETAIDTLRTEAEAQFSENTAMAHRLVDFEQTVVALRAKVQALATHLASNDEKLPAKAAVQVTETLFADVDASRKSFQQTVTRELTKAEKESAPKEQIERLRTMTNAVGRLASQVGVLRSALVAKKASLGAAAAKGAKANAEVQKMTVVVDSLHAAQEQQSHQHDQMASKLEQHQHDIAEAAEKNKAVVQQMKQSLNERAEQLIQLTVTLEQLSARAASEKAKHDTLVGLNKELQSHWSDVVRSGEEWVASLRQRIAAAREQSLARKLQSVQMLDELRAAWLQTKSELNSLKGHSAVVETRRAELTLKLADSAAALVHQNAQVAQQAALQSQLEADLKRVDLQLKANEDKDGRLAYVRGLETALLAAEREAAKATTSVTAVTKKDDDDEQEQKVRALTAAEKVANEQSALAEQATKRAEEAEQRLAAMEKVNADLAKQVQLGNVAETAEAQEAHLRRLQIAQSQAEAEVAKLAQAAADARLATAKARARQLADAIAAEQKVADSAAFTASRAMQDAVQRRLTSLRIELGEARMEAQQKADDLAEMEKATAEAKKAFEEAKNISEEVEIKGTAKEIKQRVSKLSRKISTMTDAKSQQVAELHAQAAALRAKAAAAKAALEAAKTKDAIKMAALRKDAKTAQHEVNVIKIQLRGELRAAARKQKTVLAQHAEVELLLRQNAELERQKQKNAHFLQALKQSRSSLESQVESSEKQADGSKSESASASKAAAELLAKLDKAHKQIDLEQTQVKQQVAKAEAELHAAEERQEQAESALEQTDAEKEQWAKTQKALKQKVIDAKKAEDKFADKAKKLRAKLSAMKNAGSVEQRVAAAEKAANAALKQKDKLESAAQKIQREIDSNDQHADDDARVIAELQAESRALITSNVKLSKGKQSANAKQVHQHLIAAQSVVKKLKAKAAALMNKRDSEVKSLTQKLAAASSRALSLAAADKMLTLNVSNLIKSRHEAEANLREFQASTAARLDLLKKRYAQERADHEREYGKQLRQLEKYRLQAATWLAKQAQQKEQELRAQLDQKLAKTADAHLSTQRKAYAAKLAIQEAATAKIQAEHVKAEEQIVKAQKVFASRLVDLQTKFTASKDAQVAESFELARLKLEDLARDAASPTEFKEALLKLKTEVAHQIDTIRADSKKNIASLEKQLKRAELPTQMAAQAAEAAENKALERKIEAAKARFEVRLAQQRQAAIAQRAAQTAALAKLGDWLQSQRDFELQSSQARIAAQEMLVKTGQQIDEQALARAHHKSLAAVRARMKRASAGLIKQHTHQGDDAFTRALNGLDHDDVQLAGSKQAKSSKSQAAMDEYAQKAARLLETSEALDMAQGTEYWLFWHKCNKDEHHVNGDHGACVKNTLTAEELKQQRQDSVKLPGYVMTNGELNEKKIVGVIGEAASLACKDGKGYDNVKLLAALRKVAVDPKKLPSTVVDADGDVDKEKLIKLLGKDTVKALTNSSTGEISATAVAGVLGADGKPNMIKVAAVHAAKIAHDAAAVDLSQISLKEMSNVNGVDLDSLQMDTIYAADKQLLKAHDTVSSVLKALSTMKVSDAGLRARLIAEQARVQVELRTLAAARFVANNATARLTKAQQQADQQNLIVKHWSEHSAQLQKAIAEAKSALGRVKTGDKAKLPLWISEMLRSKVLDITPSSAKSLIELSASERELVDAHVEIAAALQLSGQDVLKNLQLSEVKPTNVLSGLQLNEMAKSAKTAKKDVLKGVELNSMKKTAVAVNNVNVRNAVQSKMETLQLAKVDFGGLLTKLITKLSQLQQRADSSLTKAKSVMSVSLTPSINAIRAQLTRLAHKSDFAAKQLAKDLKELHSLADRYYAQAMHEMQQRALTTIAA